MSTKLYEEQNDEGGTSVYVLPDGFRARRIRGEGWLEQAMADGLIEDPGNPKKVKRAKNPGDKVIEVPVATLGSIAHKLREE